LDSNPNTTNYLIDVTTKTSAKLYDPLLVQSGDSFILKNADVGDGDRGATDQAKIIISELYRNAIRDQLKP
jgi:hypothetical protein